MNGVPTTTIAGDAETKRLGQQPVRRRNVSAKSARFLGALAGLYLLFAGAPANAQMAIGTAGVGQLPSAVAVNPAMNTTYVANSGSGTVTAFSDLNYSETTITVGSGPDALAVNPATGQIYVANSGSSNVSVINGATNAVTNTIAVGGGPDAIAVDMVTNQIYVANEASGTVSVIDGNGVNPTATVTVGTNPVALALNPITNKVYVVNSGSGNVTVINAASNNSTQSVGVGTNPVAVAIDAVTNEAYVANAGGTVSVIGSSNTVTSTVTVGTTPNGVAVDPVTGKIYVANMGSGTLTTIDASTKATASLAAGSSPFAVAVSPTTNEVFVANNGSTGANGITVFSGAIGGTATAQLAQLAGGNGPRALAVNPVTNRVYVANFGTSGVSSTMTIVDGATYSMLLQSGGTEPYAVAVNPVTNQIYVSDTGDGVHNSAVTVIDGPSGNVVASVPVGANPVGIAVNPLTNKIYVVNQGSGVVSGNVTIINGATNSPTTVTVGNGPDAIGVDTATNQIYVANYVDGSVSIIDGNSGSVVVTVGVAPHPQALAVNSASNEVYVATASGPVAIINGAGVATQVNAGNDPYAVAVNPTNNRAYVANYGDGTVTAIDGNNGNATTTITAGSGPIGIAVNPVTNRVYVANQQSSNVTVIDVNNGNYASSIPAGTAPWSVTVNPATNRIYVPNAGSNNITEIDGASGIPTTISAGTQPQFAAVNPVTNEIYAANVASNNVTIISEATPQTIPLTTTIQPLTGNIATSVNPAFSFSTSNALTNSATVVNLFYQIDSLSGAWTAAQGTGSFSATTATLAPGFHVMYAYSTDGEAATSTATSPDASPVIGGISAYGFTVQPAGVTVMPSSLTFPNQQATTTGSPQTITLTNGGGQTLQFSFAYSDITEFPESSSDSCTAAAGQLAVGASCTISISFAPQLPPGAKTGTLTITDNANGVPGSQQTVTFSGTALGNVSPGLTWPTPAAVTYGAALTGTQLDATTSLNGTAVPGTFVYTPVAGTVLAAGSQKLSVTFTPTDTLTYATTTTTVQLVVNKAPLTVAAGNVTAPYNTTPAYTATYSGFVNGDTSAVVSGTPAFTTNATTNPIAPGSYTITPGAGTLTATNYAFTNFTTATLKVVQVPTVTVTSNQSGSTPLYGTTVTLTATVTSITGTPTGNVSFYDAVTGATCTSLSSSLALGTQALTGTTAVLNTTGIMAGTQTILACYNGDANNYPNGGSTTQSMAQGVPVVTWATPAPVNYGTALSSIQLDATSTAMGTFAYTPKAGTVVGAGTQTLSVTFTPQDPIDYKTVTATVQLVVNQAPANSEATVSETLPAGTSPKAVAVNPITNKTYVVNNSSNSVTIYDGSTNTSSTVAVGNQPDAVAVNAVTNQIYVANYADGTVSIIDGTTNLVSGPVTVGSDPTVLAVNPATNRVYVVNQGSNSVTMINAAFSNATTTITVGTNPYAVAVNPVTNDIYVSNQGPGGVGGNISVIDGATNTVSTVTDPAASGPYSVAVNPVTNTIFVTNLASKTVSVVNGATNAVASVSVGTSPWAVDVNPVTNKAYVANYGSGTVTVINAGSGNATSTVTVGTDPDAVAVNPVTNQVYVANLGSGNFTVIDGSSNTPTNVAAGTGPVAIGVNPVTDRIFVANNGSGNVSVVDGATNTTSTIATGSQPLVVAVNPVTGNIYAANYNDGTVTVIAGGTVNTVTVGPYPSAIAINPVTNKIYVVFAGTSTVKGNVTVIDGATNTPTLITVGNGPNAIAVNPVTNEIFVTNYVDATVSVINGLTNSVVPVSVGVHPYAIAVNPVTNKIYAAALVNSTAGIVTVIDGTTNTPTANVTIGDYPLAIAVNPVTNKIYVANSNLDYYPTPGTLTVIDGVSNTPTTINAGIEPFALAINTITNQIYLANKDGNSIMVVDGASNNTTTLSVGQNPFAIAVNPVTNKIYVPNAGPVSGSYYFSVIDGATNYVTTLSGGTQPVAAAVNPVSNQVFIANQFSNNLTALTEQQVQTIQIATTIQPLSGNATNISSPTFTFSAVNNFTGAPVDNVLYQVDTWEGRWTPATSLGSGNFSGSTTPLTAGYHILYAYATDGEEGTTTAAGLQSSPIMGNIVAYGFVVATTGGGSGATLNPNTFSFAGEPEEIASPAQTATLSNGGNTPLTFSVAFGGTNASDFTETTDTCSTLGGSLAANSSCTINIIFTPTQKGVSESATLTVTDNSNGVAGSTQTIALSGIGTGNEKPTISWTPGAITYGTALTSGQLPTAAYQGTTVAGAYTDTPTLSSLGAGTQTVSVTFTPTDTTDYTSATQSFQITISPAPLTVKAGNVTWGYGATPAFTATYTGFVNGDTSAVLTGTPVFTTTATTTPIPVGTYTITPAQGTLTATNYIFTNFATGTLVVTTATPTITWGTQGALPSITYPAALGSALNATASFNGTTVAGTFAYSSTSGAVTPTTVLTAGSYTLTATFTPTSTTDYTNATATATLAVLLPTQVTFAFTDTTTSGNWEGKYGADGYVMANVTPSLPSYASFNISNQLNYTWNPNTTDTRALEIPGGTGRIASTWYNPSTFSIAMNLSDGNAHLFALYALDWDNSGREETVQILNATTMQQLDSRTISNFQNGVYLVWNISGNVIINVTNAGGNNAALSAAFFGGSATGGTETVTVTPANPTLTAGQTQTFSATISGTSNTSQTVAWAITGVTPSTAAEGTINASTGAYTAPASGTIAAATVTITATDQDAVTGTTTVTLNPGAVSGGNGATFITTDTTTSGSWIGKYGADGYSLAGATASLPSYDQAFAPVNQINYTWAPTTTDPRGLQIPGGTGNFAATWYNPTTFSFNVDFTDGQTHEFALYAVDWTSSGRSETVQIQDGVTGLPLDTRPLSNFTNGAYLVWNLSGNVKVVVTTTAGVNSVISGAFFGGSGTSGPETVTVTPANPTLTAGAQQTFGALIAGTANTSQTITWAITGVSPSTAAQGTINASTGVYTAPSSGTIAAATVTITATDQDAVKGTTTLTLNPGAVSGGNGATFIKTDTTTSGSWIGKYGSDGYSLATVTPSVPSYAAFGVQNQINFTWQPSTTDPRALQIPGGTGNFAATWYNSSAFTMTVNFTDGQTHQLALYAVDWDNIGRTETIQIQDGVSGLPLDSRTLSNFGNGAYEVWNISGNVKIVVTSNNSDNAVISGVFFGGSAAPGPETVTVTPANPTLTGGQTQTFAAAIGGTTNTSQTVTWAITGVTPSTAAEGTINASTGAYTAPASGTIAAATVTITATDQDAVTGTTTVTLNPGAVSGGNGATFITTDTTTSGSWIGKYGADGYSLAGATASLPSYDQAFAPVNQINYTWAPTTTDPRGLQIPGGTGNFAATWYNPTTFSFNVDFTDGQTHEFALYAVDWTSSGRSETVQIQDGVTGLPLDTRPLSNFTNGAYLVWNLSGNVKVVVTTTAGVNSVISGAFFGGSGTSGPETVTVTPANPTLTAGAQQTFGALIAGTANTSQTITWAITGVTPSTAAQGTINASTGVYTAPSSGTIAAATVTITATDQDAVKGTTTVTLNPGAVSGGNGATFIKSDTTTSGAWQGVYGANGYDIVNVTPSLPSYATFAVQNQLNFTWQPSTTDPRALEIPGGTGGIASTWYNSSTFGMTVDFTDGQTHQLALYALDWDSLGRSETVVIQDGASGLTLDTRTVTNFSNGTYLVWNISGNVKIVVTSNNSDNAVISGVFFGGSAAPGPETVTVTPANPTLTGGQTQTFAAAIGGTTNTSQTVTWAITGVTPSTAPEGTINANTGAYTAPASGTIAAAAVTITATDQDAVTGTTTVTLNPGAVTGANRATFIKMDTTTSGSWKGVYGSDGYMLANSGSSLPSYDQGFGPFNQINFTWLPSTTDPRALQIPGGTGGIAAAWYNPATFSFTINFNDGQTHQFALYALDWDGGGRVETIQIQDATSGLPLDTRTVSNFSNGTYVVWNISGNVKVVVTSTAGANAVISGAFFK